MRTVHPPTVRSGPQTQSRLQGYDIQEVWCEQRHTVIYRGIRGLDGLPVLIKTLRDAKRSDPRGAWLQREYEITRFLRAGCAAKPFLFENSELGPTSIYAFEGAQPLETLASGAPLDIEIVLTVGAGIAEAVGALHRESLIHCNLNPATIWFSRHGDTFDIFVSEFGCARHPSAGGAASAAPFDELTDIRYISPEQTGRVQRIADQRSDIYSIGIIIFQLLTGAVPFRGRNPLHILDGHLAKVPEFPEELLGSLPSGLRRIVLKALEKNPEARYWSASGLLADLLDCRSLWRVHGDIEDFAPGRLDAKGVLRFSRHLYGRERDTAALLEKVRAVQHGRPAMLLVSGAPGVGKSALLGTLEEFVRNQSGRFVAGKFDQYKRNVPYLALTQSVQQLIEQILSEPQKQIEAWRQRILSALGRNAGVVTEVIPALELIIGRSPPIAALTPIQARNRFNRVFTNLIQVFAAKGELLCLVMDDMQWADAASLSLLAHVLANPQTRNILFVGAYRDNEVGPTHPLNVTALMEAGIDVQIMHLTEIKEPEVLQLIRDTFNASSSSEVRELSRILHAKTDGNPLYVRQLLHFLYDKGLIAFDYHSGKWVWDLSRIREEGVTQDILDLLKKRLLALHENTRTIFAVTACVGSAFDVEKVSVATDRPISEVLQSVMIGVDQGLIVPLKGWAIGPGHDPPSTHESKGRFRFLHDRVQQAAFDCVPSDAKKDFRLLIGLRLMNSLSADDELVPQPDVLSNLNFAWELIADHQQRLRAARLNLVAGRTARQSLAYQDALNYICIGLGLLGDQSWQNAHELAFELHSEALECEYLTGNFAHADELFDVLVANARSKQEKARTYLTKILLETSEERYEEAIKVGIEALSLFRVRYHRKPSHLHLLAELMQARLRMKGRKPQDLTKAKGLDDPERVAALRILVALFPTAYFLSPDLLLFTGLKVVNYSLRHGISPLSAGGFVLYGLGLGAALDDHERGYDFGRFALDLAEKSNDPAIICKVLVIFSMFIKFWRDPIDESFELIDRARKMGLEVGDHQYVGYAILGSIAMPFSRGTNLAEILRLCDEHRPFVTHSKDAFTVESLTMWQNCALALRGKTAAPHSLSDGAYDENEAELRYHTTGNLTLASYQYTLRLQLACVFGRYIDAVILSDKGEAVIRSAPGYITVADHYLYRGLAAAEAVIAHAPKSRRHGRVLRHCRARLHLFAANSARNFETHEALLEAEFLRSNNELNRALKQYDRAIELAEPQGFTQLVAIGNERAALSCIANGQPRLAGWYLTSSRAAYDRWGAIAKVAWLDHEYPSLLSSASTPVQPIAAAPLLYRSSHSQDEAFDIAAALRASRIITSDHDVDRLLTHLMRVVRLQAGAETAQLLLVEGNDLRLEAFATADDRDVNLSPCSSVGPATFSPAVVNYVLHTGDDLMLGEAGNDPRFANCSYLAKRRPKSVICSGIRHGGQLLGAIYLEHTQLAGVFNEQKLEWLRLLTTELGLTIWGGRLGHYRDYLNRFAPTAVSKELEKNPLSPDLAVKDRDVSILFADLASYTRMAELMERRQLDDLIDRAFSRFIDEIHRYDGIVLEFRGDEVFALFEDDDRARHVWKAASTALAIRRAAAGLNRDLCDAPLPIVMNIGINSGVASVGLRAVEASSGPRWRYGASGTVVNVAARVRELARDGNILMTSDTVARGLPDFVFKDMGEHSLKNVMSPIRVYRLVDELSE